MHLHLHLVAAIGACCLVPATATSVVVESADPAAMALSSSSRYGRPSSSIHECRSALLADVLSRCDSLAEPDKVRIAIAATHCHLRTSGQEPECELVVDDADGASAAGASAAGASAATIIKCLRLAGLFDTYSSLYLDAERICSEAGAHTLARKLERLSRDSIESLGLLQAAQNLTYARVRNMEASVRGSVAKMTTKVLDAGDNLERKIAASEVKSDRAATALQGMLAQLDDVFSVTLAAAGFTERLQKVLVDADLTLRSVGYYALTAVLLAAGTSLKQLKRSRPHLLGIFWVATFAGKVRIVWGASYEIT